MIFSPLRIFSLLALILCSLSCGHSGGSAASPAGAETKVQPISIQSVWDLSRFPPTTHVFAIAECVPAPDHPNEPTVRLIRMTMDGSPVDPNRGMMRLWFLYPDKSKEDRVVSYANDNGSATYTDSMINGMPMIRWVSSDAVLFSWDGTTCSYLDDCPVSGRHTCTVMKQQVQ